MCCEILIVVRILFLLLLNLSHLRLALHGLRLNYGCVCSHYHHLVQFLSTSRLQLTKYYWKYTGSDTSQEWTPDMVAGTEVRFQVIDLNGVKVTSGVVTVQVSEMIGIRYPQVAIADICELLDAQCTFRRMRHCLPSLYFPYS